MIIPFFVYTEQFFFLTALLFPPVLAVIVLVVILSTLGKSLGIRERYVGLLIKLFEWGACQIYTSQMQRKQSRVFAVGDDDEIDGTESDEEKSIEQEVDAISTTSHARIGEYCFLGGIKNEINVQRDNEKLCARTSKSENGESTRLKNVYNNDDNTAHNNNFNGLSSVICYSDLQSEKYAPFSRSLSTNSTVLQRRNESTTSLSSLSSIRVRHNSGQNIIRRATAIHLDEDDYKHEKTIMNSRGWQVINDSFYFMRAGLEAIIEDEVTSRFQAEQLASWNMLTRTSISFNQFVNWKLTLLWVIGCFFRYLVLLPLRLLLFVLGMSSLVFTTAAIGIVPNGSLKRWLNEKCMLMCYRILARCISAVIYFHDIENKAKNGGICVANHTSPIDVLVLGTDNIYALVGQQHSGVLGVLQRALDRASAHIWFERGEVRDRALVAKRLKSHVDDPNKLPILVFPEGTCINNTSVMMFKKGSFEVGAKVYPIALKYDSRFGDPFWNSNTQSWLRYVTEIITSWALICHVWYLPPMERLTHESAIEFANRVKKTIAIRGGMVDLEWDGQLKRSRVPPKLLEKQQEKYYQRYTRYTSFCEPPLLQITSSITSDFNIDNKTNVIGNTADNANRIIHSKIMPDLQTDSIELSNKLIQNSLNSLTNNKKLDLSAENCEDETITTTKAICCLSSNELNAATRRKKQEKPNLGGRITH